MSSSVVRIAAVGFTLLSLAACAAQPASTPPGAPSSTDVNPVTGARGGTNGK